MPPPTLKKITDRHHRLAFLRACGFTNVDICRDLGYTPTRVSALCSHPEIQILVQKYRDEYFAGASKSLAEEILLEGGKTLDRLVVLRDQEEDIAVAARVALGLLPYQVAELKKPSEEHLIKIQISHSDLAEMEHANQKMKVLDATFKHLE